MIAAGAVDRAVTIARELLVVNGDMADPAAACVSAAEVAATAGAPDLVAEVLARAEVLDTPMVSATAASLAYRQGDDATGARLLERATARAGAHSDDGDRALGFAQIAQAIAPVRGEDARAAASAAISAVAEMKRVDAYALYKLDQVIAALEAVGDFGSLERFSQARFESDVHRNFIYHKLAGAYARCGESERALAALSACQHDSGSIDSTALSQVAIGLAAAGRTEEALAAAELLPAGGKRASSLAAVAQHLQDTGADRPALEIAEQAILGSEYVEHHDLHAAAVGSIASALARAGAADLALNAAREAWRILSTFAPEDRGGLAVELVATALAKVGLVDESLDAASEYRSEPFRASIIEKLGLVLAGRGEHHAAVQLAHLLQQRASGSYEEPELRAATAEILALQGTATPHVPSRRGRQGSTDHRRQPPTSIRPDRGRLRPHRRPRSRCCRRGHREGVAQRGA